MMSEVKTYQVIGYLVKGKSLGRINVVSLSDYDALAAQFDEGLAREAELKALSVKNIMLDVVPGEDGMGEEVYAKSVEQVVAKFSKYGELLEMVTDERNALRQRLAKVEKLAAQKQLMLRDASEHRKQVRANDEKAIKLLKDVRDTGGELSKVWFKKLSDFLASPGCADGEKS